MRRCFILVFIFSFITDSAQNVVIRGLSHYMHKGKTINAYTYDDLVTYTRVKQATDTIDEKGAFELAFDVTSPTKVEVIVENLIGNMYVLPQNYYAVTFPKPDSLYDLNPNTEYPVELGFVFKEQNDTTEMNSLIINFNREYRKFFVTNYQYFVAKKKFHEKLDSFQLACMNKYEFVKEPYFKNWLRYTFADINENSLRNRAVLFNAYIANKPILHENFEYMRFFNIYFSQYMMLKATTKKGASIIDIINENGDFRMLNETMKKDPYLQNDTLRELVLIKGLYELYFSPDFKRENVLQMIEEAGRTTSNYYHKKIVQNILKIIYKLSPGSDAPSFTLKNAKGETVSLKDFRGKYVYLDFMATWCGPCLQELKEMVDLKKKYGDKVVFISISVDDKEEDLKKFLQKNPKYEWQFLWYGTDKQVKARYNIKALPTYYFINQEGKLVLSPAPTPRSGFELTLEKMFSTKKHKGPMDK
jgi:thiol-disulfide isomerase/thioredoxin